MRKLGDHIRLPSGFHLHRSCRPLDHLLDSPPDQQTQREPVRHVQRGESLNLQFLNLYPASPPPHQYRQTAYR